VVWQNAILSEFEAEFSFCSGDGDWLHLKHRKASLVWNCSNTQEEFGLSIDNLSKIN
jgi:hypothetical protein